MAKTIFAKIVLLQLVSLFPCIFSRPNDIPQVYCPETIPNSTGRRYDSFELPDGSHRYCCLCNKGRFFSAICNSTDHSSTQCLPCPPGTYMDETAHRLDQCKPHNLSLDCRSDQHVISGTAVSQVRCDCKYGTFNTTYRKCQKWKTCLPGFGVLQDGTPFSDVICEACKPGYYSPKNSSVEHCQRIKKHQTTPLTLPDMVKNTEKKTNLLGIMLGIVAAIVLLIFASIYFFWKKKQKQTNQDREQEDEMELQPLSNSASNSVVPRPQNTSNGHIDTVSPSSSQQSPNTSDGIYKIIEYFEGKADKNDFVLTHDDVNKFVRHRSELPRYNPGVSPSTRMAAEIKRLYDENKADVTYVIEYFERKGLRSIVDDLNEVLSS